MEISAPKYFLAANSSEGFKSYFDSFYKNSDSWSVYIIKGGPGTGKSSFMKYIAAKCFDKGIAIELCPCSSDPDSLDGLIIPQLKVAFLDGTAPHVIEPVYPGVCEHIINLGEFWHDEVLKERADEIIKATAENKNLHRAAGAYLAAAGELYGDTLMLSQRFCDTKKALKIAERIAQKQLPPKGTNGSEEIRFITGITPKGVVSFGKTITDYFRSHVIIEDNLGGASAIIISRIREIALKRGYSIISLKNAFLPSQKTDHILIPELSLAFCSEHRFVHFNSSSRRIHARRFYDKVLLSQFKNRLSFNRKTSDKLYLIAAETLLKAKKSHDRLEKFYIDAMDFSAVSAKSQDITRKILNI